MNSETMWLASFCVAAVLLAKDCVAQNVPCIQGFNLPTGCDDTRIKPCSAFTASEIAGSNLIESSVNYGCSRSSPRMRNTVFASPETNTYYVQFDDAGGNCFGIIMEAGECWGMHPTNGGDYDCQGRCGGGCSNGNSNWARDCLKHDVCSWYFSASGGFLDSNCGDSFGQATNDFLSFSSSCRASGDSCVDPTPAPTILPTPAATSCGDVQGLVNSNGDSVPCKDVLQFCSAFSIVRERCQKSCGECGGGSDGSTGPICTDNVPSGLRFTNGNPAECSEIGQFCAEFDFVRAACPATCGLCGTGSLVALPVDKARPDLPMTGYPFAVLGIGLGAGVAAGLAFAALVARMRRGTTVKEAPVEIEEGDDVSAQEHKAVNPMYNEE